MRFEDIHIGDRLRIRQWDDMAREFGLTGTGHINCIFSFNSKMRPLCGREFTVSDITLGGGFVSKEGIEYERDNGRWSISADMLEPTVTEDPWSPPDVNPAELFSVLLGGN